MNTALLFVCLWFYVASRKLVFLLLFFLFLITGCATGKGHWCDSVYLDPTCVQRRLAEQKRIEKEFVKVCAVKTGSRIKKVSEEDCELMKREAVRRAIETRGGQ